VIGELTGLPGPAKVKRLRGIATSDDLVHRKFHRLTPNELWVTDITEHPTTWIPVIVATPVCQLGSSKARRRSAGVSQPRLLRGRALSSAATCWSSSGVCLERSVPLGKYCRSSPLDAPMFVNLPRALNERLPPLP
jgi:hypothetical protein